MVFLKLSGWFSARLGPTPCPWNPGWPLEDHAGILDSQAHSTTRAVLLCFCVICYDVETATVYQLHRVVERTSRGHITSGRISSTWEGLHWVELRAPQLRALKCECSVRVLNMSQACSKHFTCTIQSILLHWRPGVRKMTTAKLVFGISLPGRTYCTDHTFNSHPGELPCTPGHRPSCLPPESFPKKALL